MILTEETFLFEAAKVYRKRLSVSTQAFLLDANHLDLNSDFTKYFTNKEPRLLRLLINKLIIAVNLFGPDATTFIIFRLSDPYKEFAYHLFDCLSISDKDFQKDEVLLNEIKDALQEI